MTFLKMVLLDFDLYSLSREQILKRKYIIHCCSKVIKWMFVRRNHTNGIFWLTNCKKMENKINCLKISNIGFSIEHKI